MELLIMAEDITDFTIGDVIDIRKDGHVWGKSELNNPRFAIVTIDDTDLCECDIEARERWCGAMECVDHDPNSLDRPPRHQRWCVVDGDLIEKVPARDHKSFSTVVRKSRVVK